MEDFIKILSQQKQKHGIILSILTFILATVWILNNLKIPSSPLVGNPYIVMTLEYIGMLGTGFCIWYGYYTYNKTANILKQSDNIAEKQKNYISSKQFQNNLIYLIFIVDIILFAITQKEQFAFTSVISLIFCTINFPTVDKYENDFIEPTYDDEHFESEFNTKHQNDIKQNFEEN